MGEVSVPNEADMDEISVPELAVDVYTVYWHMVYRPSTDKLDIVRMRVKLTKNRTDAVAMFEFRRLHYLHAPWSLGLDGLLVVDYVGEI